MSELRRSTAQPLRESARVNHTDSSTWNVKTQRCRVCSQVERLCSCHERTTADRELVRMRLLEVEMRTDFGRFKLKKMYEEVLAEEEETRARLSEEANEAFNGLKSLFTIGRRLAAAQSNQRRGRHVIVTEYQRSLPALRMFLHFINDAGLVYADETHWRKVIWLDFCHFYEIAMSHVTGLNNRANLEETQAAQRNRIITRELECRGQLVDDRRAYLDMCTLNGRHRQAFLQDATFQHDEYARYLLEDWSRTLEQASEFVAQLLDMDAHREVILRDALADRRHVAVAEHDARLALFAWHEKQQTIIIARLEVWHNEQAAHIHAEGVHRCEVEAQMDRVVENMWVYHRKALQHIKLLFSQRAAERHAFVLDATQIKVSLAIRESVDRATLRSQFDLQLDARRRWCAAKQRQRDSALRQTLERRARIERDEEATFTQLVGDFNRRLAFIEQALMEHSIRVDELAREELTQRRRHFEDYLASMVSMRRHMEDDEAMVYAFMEGKRRARTTVERDEVDNRLAMAKYEAEVRALLCDSFIDFVSRIAERDEQYAADRRQLLYAACASLQDVTWAQDSARDTLMLSFNSGLHDAWERTMARQRRVFCETVRETLESLKEAEAAEWCPLTTEFEAHRNFIRAKEHQIFIANMRMVWDHEQSDRQELFAADEKERFVIAFAFRQEHELVRQAVLQREREELLARQEMMREDDRGWYHKFGDEAIESGDGSDMIPGRRSGLAEFTAVTRLSGVHSLDSTSLLREYAVNSGFDVSGLSAYNLSILMAAVDKTLQHQRELRDRIAQTNKSIAEREKKVERYLHELGHERECHERHSRVLAERRAALQTEAASHKKMYAQRAAVVQRDQSVIQALKEEIAATKARTQDIRNAVRDQSLQHRATAATAKRR